MTKQIWINLPVKDVNASKTFFCKLGFSFNEKYANTNDSACLLIGDKSVVVMLFTEKLFEGFIQHKIADTKQGNEVLFSLDAESREEVDEFAKKVIEAGGSVFSKPAENQGWMYGFGFQDLDNHRWNVLFMDMNKLPK
jgi:predicted lactoylglutathione lyase